MASTPNAPSDGARPRARNQKIIANGNAIEHARCLKFSSDSEVRKGLKPSARDISAGNVHAAGGRAHDPGQHVEKRALASTIWTDDAQGAGLADCHADAVNGNDPAEASRQRRPFEQRGRGHDLCLAVEHVR